MRQSPGARLPRVREFWLFWAGESISLFGDEFYLVALPWLALELTGDALSLGTILAAATIPRTLLMLIGGALVDRFSPRHVMFVSNLARMAIVTLLAVLVLTNQIQLWHLYVLALAFGTADAFYVPAQSAIVPAILGTDQLDIGNTFTQGSAMLSMFLGPLVSGLVIAALSGAPNTEMPSLTGLGLAFALDAFSFLASLVCLWLMRLKLTLPLHREDTLVEAIQEGTTYIRKQPTMRSIFIVLVIMNLFVTGVFDVGIPVLAKNNLGEGAAAFGILMSAYGAGALFGVIASSALPRPKPAHLGTVLMLTSALVGVCVALMPLTDSTPLVALLCIGMGVNISYVEIHFMTWMQKRVPRHLMGRVMSLLMFATVGIAPVSSAAAGLLLDANLPLLFIGSGALLTVTSLLFIGMRPIRTMGLELGTIRTTLAQAIRSTGEMAVVANKRTTVVSRAVKP